MVLHKESRMLKERRPAEEICSLHWQYKFSTTCIHIGGHTWSSLASGHTPHRLLDTLIYTPDTLAKTAHPEATGYKKHSTRSTLQTPGLLRHGKRSWVLWLQAGGGLQGRKQQHLAHHTAPREPASRMG